MAELKTELRQVLSGDRAIIAGPWLSEVGFEVLYWIPFLRWVVEHAEIPPERITAVSRGGVSHWYKGICGSYVDILEIMSPDDYRRRTLGRWRTEGGQKQLDRGKWDRRVLRQLRDKLPDRDGQVLHPSLMYRFFAPYWRGQSPLAHVTEHARFAPLPLPTLETRDRVRLPSEEFVAVKLYFRHSFPDSPANRRAVDELLAALADKDQVVLLDTGLVLDDHPDVDVSSDLTLKRPLLGVSPDRNLLAQDALLCEAQAFHGTYGGLAYLAAFRGLQSRAYYSHAEHLVPRHLEVAQEAASVAGGTLETVDITKMPSLHQ